MPALTRFYGILPRDIDSMSFREVSEYRIQYQEFLAKQSE